jgi:hypothetical protein
MSAEHGSDRRPMVDETHPDLEGSNLGSVLAVIVVAGLAVALALLPAAIALRVLELAAGSVGASLGILGAAVGGVKLIAVAWALGARLSGPHVASVAVAPSD